jgi:carboxypeptidase C (cathepsin A)
MPKTAIARLVTALVLAAGLGLASPVTAQQGPGGRGGAGAQGQQGGQQGGSSQSSAPRPGLPPLPADSTTQHQITVGGRTLAFSATAGTVTLRNAETGAPTAALAVIAYRLNGADAASRPVTFVFNGGPGYASGWLHLGALGPWRLPMEQAAAYPSAPPKLIDNPDTWLDFTDLVFIDPPGTGYGRIMGGDDVRKSFFSVGGDVNALAVTIRRWSEANGRMESPKFILGESYGGFRAPKIAHVLQTDQGVGVNGLVLVSPVLDFPHFNAATSPLGLVARLPGLVAVTRERKGPITRETMKDVEDYATGDFLQDLLRGVNDKAAVDRIARRVADLTGLDPEAVRRLGGRVPNGWFAREINRGKDRISSMYDGNVTGLDATPFAPRGDAEDQMRLGLHAPITQAMVDLYQTKLDWKVENGRYQFINEQAGRQWDYGRNAEAVRDLRSALALDPHLRVIVLHGLTDLVTPYFESKLVLDQIPDFGTPERLKLIVYPGGHMIYSRDDSRHAMHEDGRRLVEGR